MTARIARALHDELVARAAASPHVEVCGLLLGDARDARDTALEVAQGERIIALHATANIATDPARRFEIDPAALFAALRAERDGGSRLVGHYHSHPEGLAIPSTCDAAMARDRGRLWLIVGGGEVAAWRAVPGGPVHDAFAPVTLVVTENGCETGH